MSEITACPLDCYDACEIIFNNSKLLPVKEGHTQGFLCPHLHHYAQHTQIQDARYKGEIISIEEALDKLKEFLQNENKNKILHYRGSGNFALMQEVTDHFFASFGAHLTEGTLCDGAGEAGIIQGRGSNKNMPISEIDKSEVVIFWGRNPHTTSSHLLPLLKGKKIIVIDPVKTKIANMADLYIQIKPHTDIYLAMLIVRFLYINDAHDEEYLEKYASEFEDYYELTQGIRIKSTLETMGVTLGDIGDIIEMTQKKKVAIVCGVGVQKYSDGADIVRAIDAVAVTLGLFGKEGCGIAYLGNSKEAIESPFFTKAKRVSKIDTEFSNYTTVFIQGANPLSQMPNTSRVKTSLEKVENIVYFGLYENETSELADLVIPAKNFLQKNDIRTSYSHNKMMIMHQQKETNYGISEYALTQFLSQAFGIEMKSEEYYIKHFKSFAQIDENGSMSVKTRESIPYKDGFDTDDGEFVFLEDLEVLNIQDDFHLITPKSAKSLNSQFQRESYVYLHPSLGYKEDEKLLLRSSYGSVKLQVKHKEELRDDCILIYSGTKGVNNLTSSKHSFDGKCAIFQESMICIERL